MRASLVLLTLPALAGCSHRGQHELGRFEVPLAAAAQAGDEIVATVDGRPIYASAVATQAQAKGCSTKEALEDLVRAEAVVSEAERHKLAHDRDALEAARSMAVLRLLETGFQREVTQATIPDRTVRRTYRANINMYDHSEYIDVWHILQPVAKNASPEDKQKARAVAEEIARRARGVGSALAFQQLATAVKQPAGLQPLKVERLVTARDGWILTTFSYPAFDQLKKPGDTSTVIETEYGYHVVYLNRRIPPLHRTVEDAAQELRSAIFPNYQKSAFISWVADVQKQHDVRVHAERLGQPPAPEAAPQKP